MLTRNWLSSLKKLSFFCIIGLPIPFAIGQTPPAENHQPADLTPKSGFDGGMSTDQLQKLGDFMDMRNMLVGKDSEKSKMETLKETKKLIKKLNLSCDITDAVQAAKGKSDTGAEVKLYEVACSNAMGYLFVAQAEKATSISCFAADVTHADDLAKGQKSELYCQLADNKDLLANASKILSSTSVNCDAVQVRWYGSSQATQTEYTEVSCKDGKGYLIQTALPGNTKPATSISCLDSVKKGLACKITDTGIVSLDDIAKELNKNSLNCPAEKIRVIGKEKIRKRYVVEAHCSDKTSGIIAFVPFEATANKFEAMTCDEAKKIGINCKAN